MIVLKRLFDGKDSLNTIAPMPNYTALSKLRQSIAKSSDRSAYLHQRLTEIEAEFKQATLQIPDLREMMSEVDMLGLTKGIPNKEQLATINEFLQESTTAEEWYLLPVRASDNLVSRSLRKWHPNVLQQMLQQYPGTVALIDHEWEEVEDSIGFNLDAELITTPSAPDWIINSPGREEYNQEIISEEGYVSLYVTMAIATDMASIIAGTRYRRLNGVSTGGLLSGIKMICPNCSRDYGREVTFTERNKNGEYLCPHLIPSTYSALYSEDEDEMGERESEYADYLVLDGVFDAVEVSVVNSGNLPAAGVLR